MPDVHEIQGRRRRRGAWARVGVLTTAVLLALLATACHPSGNTLEGKAVISLHKELFGSDPVGRVSCTSRQVQTYPSAPPSWASSTQEWEGSCTLDGRGYRVNGSYSFAPVREGGRAIHATIVAENDSPPLPDHYFCTFDRQADGSWRLHRRCNLERR